MAACTVSAQIVEEDSSKTLIVDDYLNFTYDVGGYASNDMFGLIKNLTDPQSGEDEYI